MQMLSVDEVYDVIGHLGFAQFIYLISLSMTGIFTIEHMLLNIFAGLEPSFKCYDKSKPENASHYDDDKCLENSASNCRFEFDESLSTIVSEWNLVCNEKYKVALVQSFWMGGVLVGALFSGLADHYGRLKILMLSIMCTIAFEGFAAFSSMYLIYVTFRFLGGMSCSLVILAGFVLSQELIGTSRRSLSVIISSVLCSFGIAHLSALAAHVGDWRTLTLITALSGIIFLIIPIFLPESPRWLVGKGKLKEAKKVLETIAEKNGTIHLLPTSWNVSGGGCKKDAVEKDQGVCALTSHPYILMLTLIQIYSWFVNSGVYYALTMAAMNLQGSVYWSTTLSGLVEIPACISSIIIIERYGRRFAICFFMLGGGLICMMIPFVPPSYVNTFALVGKLGISASFTVIYLHSGEIFPTVIRNTAMGVVSVAARIGGVVSPFVLMLGDVHPNLHFVVLGFMMFSAGILNSKLPETLGRPLPETIADIIAMKNEKDYEFKAKSNSVRNKGYERLHQDYDDDEGEANSASVGYEQSKCEDHLPRIFT